MRFLKRFINNKMFLSILSFKEKNEWDLQAKYNIGKKAEDEGTEV